MKEALQFTRKGCRRLTRALSSASGVVMLLIGTRSLTAIGLKAETLVGRATRLAIQPRRRAVRALKPVLLRYSTIVAMLILACSRSDGGGLSERAWTTDDASRALITINDLAGDWRSLPSNEPVAVAGGSSFGEDCQLLSDRSDNVVASARSDQYMDPNTTLIDAQVIIFGSVETASRGFDEVRQFLDECRARYVAASRTTIAGLPNGGTTNPDLALEELSISPVQLTPAGDELVAYRVIQEFDVSGSKGRVLVDTILVRVENRVQLINYLGPGGREPPRTEEERLARIAAEKLKALE